MLKRWMEQRVAWLLCLSALSWAELSRAELRGRDLSAIESLESRLRQRRDELHRRFLEQDEDVKREQSGETVVRVPGGWEHAVDVAKRHGYELQGRVRGTRDMYSLREVAPTDVGKRALGGGSDALAAKERHRRLSGDERVIWAERQHVKSRVKRDFQAKQQETDGTAAVAAEVERLFDDELWSKQWYLHDTRTKSSLPKLDLHVIGAWKQGITGKGVTVTILDDGLQHDHEDIKANYDPLSSYDLNDNDTDPMPSMNEYNKHGTRCAGEVGMVANNGLCGVGVAYNAKVGGIRMLDGKITDRLEAEALQFNIDHVDVYSASWGPNDDGKTVEGPGALAEKALYNGIYNGRGGKGVIYVWASGNGGSYQDNCDCDGYTDSIFTLSISSASQQGAFPWYGEKCSSTLATTYSSGAYTDQKITTIDLSYQDGEGKRACTTEHTGTSASAPLAAGIVALGLEANPELTWRDMQHITVWTSEPAPLLHNDGWHTNKAGLHVSNRFGFGLMNADEFVRTAKTWKNVPEQKICTTTFPRFTAKRFKAGTPGVVRFSTDACAGQKNQVNFLEHIQLVTDIDYTRRGNLMIYITSPSGTRTRLLSPRRRDNSRAGFRKWPFMSVHTWGEDPKGWWQLEVYDKDSQSGGDFGSVNNITLITYGSKLKPDHYADGARKYNYDYNSVQDRSLTDDKKRELAAIALRVGQLSDAHLSRVGPAKTKREADEHVNFANTALDRIDNLLRHERELRQHQSLAIADEHSHFISR